MGYAQDGGERTTALRNFIYDKKRNKPFAQNGGQLKKFQLGGGDFSLDDLDLFGDATATSGFQNKVKKPELPEPNIEDLFLLHLQQCY